MTTGSIKWEIRCGAPLCCCGMHLPLFPVKAERKPYFLHYEPMLRNGPNLILTNTHGRVCLTRGLTTCKMYPEHLATLKTYIAPAPRNTRSQAVGCSAWLCFGDKASCFGRGKFCTNMQSMHRYNWASSNSLGDCSLWHSLIDGLIHSLIQ